MQVPLSGSTSSTITNGASSSVTMERWSSRSSAPEYSSKRGHTWYRIVKEPLSHLPTCVRVGWELCERSGSREKLPRVANSKLKTRQVRHKPKEETFTLSHCRSLSRRMMTSLGNIWWPFSLKDRFRPSNVTFMRYLVTRDKCGKFLYLNQKNKPEV